MGAILLGSTFIPQKAHAAESDWSNIGLAKKVIENVAPIVPEIKASESVQAINFAPADFIQKPLVVDTQITPEDLPKELPLALPRETAPARPAPVRTAANAQPVRTTATASAQATAGSASATATAGGTSASATVNTDLPAHKFPYGYCTYYVAQKRYVPWSGNAISWFANARAMGFPTGQSPKPGAIMVTREGGYAGHVTYVESVSGDMVTVSEMNYKGFGVISTRTLSASSSFIIGYIY